MEPSIFQLPANTRRKRRVSFLLTSRSFSSLFKKKSSIEITEENFSYFSTLANFLKYSTLSSVCEHVSVTGKPQSFSISSLSLKSLSPRSIHRLHSFTIKIAGKSFAVNPFLFSCLSNRLFSLIKSDPNLKELQLDLPSGIDPSEFFHFFHSLIQLFSGEILDLSLFSRSVVAAVSEMFQLENFEYLEFHQPELQLSIQEVLTSFQPNQQIIPFLASNFSSFSNHTLLLHLSKLEISFIEQILESPSFFIESENVLFEILTNLVTINTKFTSLMKFVFLPAVEPNAIFKYLSQCPDMEFIRLLRSSLENAFLVPIQNSSLNMKRWSRPPTFTSPQEVKIIFSLLDSNKGSLSRLEFIDSIIHFHQAGQNNQFQSLINFIAKHFVNGTAQEFPLDILHTILSSPCTLR